MWSNFIYLIYSTSAFLLRVDVFFLSFPHFLYPSLSAPSFKTSWDLSLSDSKIPSHSPSKPFSSLSVSLSLCFSYTQAHGNTHLRKTSLYTWICSPLSDTYFLHEDFSLSKLFCYLSFSYPKTYEATYIHPCISDSSKPYFCMSRGHT